MTASAALRLTGILCAVGAAFAFSLNDTVIKFLSGSYPLHQIILARALVALVLTATAIAPLEGAQASFKTSRPWLHVLRGVCVVTANLSFFTAIAAMPLADATAIFFVAPLLITGLSVIVLGERVGPRRWACVLVGLVGVLIVVGPTNESFQMAALLPILAAFCYATLHILTRRVGLAERASTMALYTHATFVVVSITFGLVAGGGAFATDAHPSLTFLLGAWVWPDAKDLAVMAALGVASAAGGYLITQAYRQSEAGLVAPLEYLALILAIFWGFVIFGEIPTLTAAFGMALILASGLYLAVREAMLGRRPAAGRVSSRK